MTADAVAGSVPPERSGAQRGETGTARAHRRCGASGGCPARGQGPHAPSREGGVGRGRARGSRGEAAGAAMRNRRLVAPRDLPPRLGSGRRAPAAGTRPERHARPVLPGIAAEYLIPNAAPARAPAAMSELRAHAHRQHATRKQRGASVTAKWPSRTARSPPSIHARPLPSRPLPVSPKAIV